MAGECPGTPGSSPARVAATAQPQHGVGAGGEHRIVSGQHERHIAGAADLQQQIHDVLSVSRVQVTRRLVGQQDRRIVGQCARQRDALLLATRQLRRVVVPTVLEPDFIEQAPRSTGRVCLSRDLHRHHHVFERGQRRNQVKELKHESDHRASKPGQIVLAQARDVPVTDRDTAGCRRVESGNQSEQRRLAAARRPSDRQELRLRDHQIKRIENREGLTTALDGLGDVLQFDHGVSDRRTAASTNGHRLSATLRVPAVFG